MNLNHKKFHILTVLVCTRYIPCKPTYVPSTPNSIASSYRLCRPQPLLEHKAWKEDKISNRSISTYIATLLYFEKSVQSKTNLINAKCLRLDYYLIRKWNIKVRVSNWDHFDSHILQYWIYYIQQIEWNGMELNSWNFSRWIKWVWNKNHSQPAEPLSRPVL